MNIHSLGQSSRSHAHVWDRCSRRWVFREREDRTKMTEKGQAEAWNKHTSKQTQGVCLVSTSMVGHRPWQETTTPAAPQTAATYSQQAGRNTKAIHRCHAGSLHTVQQKEKEKRTYVHPREPQICGYPLRSSSDMHICVGVNERWIHINHRAKPHAVRVVVFQLHRTARNGPIALRLHSEARGHERALGDDFQPRNGAALGRCGIWMNMGCFLKFWNFGMEIHDVHG